MDDRVNIVPRPAATVVGPGTFEWSLPLRVQSEVDWGDTVAAFATWMTAEADVSVEVVASGTADVTIVRDATLPREGYRLAVRDTGVNVSTSSHVGLARALATLGQLLVTGTGPNWAVAHLTIDDAPAFAWRGLHVDIARHFFGPDDLRRLIDLMWLHRLNVMHLHLNDDQGWRLEVPQWPLLCDVGAWRASSPLGRVGDGLDDNVPHGGWLTLEDARSLVAYALARGVEIVPEIDLPGHAQAVVAAYPTLGSGRPTQVWTKWGISERVLNVEDATFEFVSDVLRTVASVFPSKFVHIGGDECPTIEWESDEHAARVMSEHGFDAARQLQGLFTDREAETLRELGRRAVAWDEVLDASVPQDVIIAAWRHVSLGRRAAEAGHDVVMAAMEFLYFDWPNSESPEEPLALLPSPFATPWEKVYGFQVIPDGLDPSKHHRVLGAQAQLWTEYIATRDHMDYMAFPRVCAFSEVVWGTANDESEFRERLRRHLSLLGTIGVNYRGLD